MTRRIGRYRQASNLARRCPLPIDRRQTGHGATHRCVLVARASPRHYPVMARELDIEQRFLVCASYGDTDSMQRFLHEGVDPDAGDAQALIHAANLGNCSMLEMLEQHGADLARWSGRALEVAVASQTWAFTEALLPHVRDVNVGDPPAIAMAARHRARQPLESMLDIGGRPAAEKARQRLRALFPNDVGSLGFLDATVGSWAKQRVLTALADGDPHEGGDPAARGIGL